MLNAIIEAAKPDLTIAITRAVAEEIGCPAWIAFRNACEDKEECFCRNAAERVLRVHNRIEVCGND